MVVLKKTKIRIAFLNTQRHDCDSQLYDVRLALFLSCLKKYCLEPLDSSKCTQEYNRSQNTVSQNTKASAKLSTGDRGPPHQPAGQFETRDRPHKPTKPLIPTAFPSKLFQIDIITAGRYIRTGPRVKRESSPGGKIRLGLPRKD